MMMENTFSGRSAIITGGGSGIGYEIAKQLLRKGVDNVILIGRNIDKLNNAKVSLGEQYAEKVRILTLDISDIENTNKMLTEYLDKLSFKVDILINNAGVMCKQLFPLITEEEFNRVMDTNIKGVFFLSQMFSKYMIKNKLKGNILMIGSTSSVRPAINPYMLSKWAIRGLTSGLAKALIPYEIVVNGIGPGPTATEMLGKDESVLYNEKNPSKRYCTVKEVGDLAIHLLGETGRMIVGDFIYISGGAATITFDDQSYKLPQF
jgi:3-oxoacyl-[acyl-carrier protein] reductase